MAHLIAGTSQLATLADALSMHTDAGMTRLVELALMAYAAAVAHWRPD
jgi:hypothetical protein